MLLEGSCHCGAVRFNVQSQHPLPYMRCYCSICRKTGGAGGFMINLAADATTLEVTGQEHVAVYRATPRHQRIFCSTCGSHLWAFNDKWPDHLHPVASAIDSELPPAPEHVHIMLGSAPDWVPVDGPGTDARFDEYPDKSIAEWHDAHAPTVERPRRSHVSVRIGTETRKVRPGTPIGELLPLEIDGHIVVAGILDRRAVPLATPVTSSAEVAGLTTEHWEGKRIYRNSLALLLLEAAQDVEPAVDIVVEYSIGFAQRIKVRGPGSANRAELAQKLQAGMTALAERDLPTRQERWTVDEAIEWFEADGARGTVELLRAWRREAVQVVTFGRAYALFTGPLVARSGMMRDFRIAADSDGLLLMYGKHGEEPDRVANLPVVSDARAASRHTREMTRDHNRWLDALEISTVGEYNRTCLRGGVSEVIHVAEGFHEKRVGQIADEIRAQAGRIKVVCLSGPSSSGKTTFIKRLKVQLQVNGIRPVSISLDNYYCDREQTPVDADGRFDYEAFEALRVNLLQDHLRQLLAGKTVVTARYDFATGLSSSDSGPQLTVPDGQILLLEGIHGLNPRLLETLPAERVFRIFACPLAQLPIDNVSRVHASDLRLLRRIVRDRRHRGTSAADTIQRWPSVRRGERRHIYPFQDNADAVFDSSLIYELSVLKVYAERYLLEVPQTQSEYMTAFRLLELTDSFVTIYPNHVPPTSMLREFIGGSGFEY